MKQAGERKSHFMPDAAVWTYPNTSGHIQEAVRGWERDTPRESRRDEWLRLKTLQKTFTLSLVKMCTRWMPGEAFWPGPSVSVMFHESASVLQLQQRMPNYIPGVSVHYFYLHAAVSLPDWSGGDLFSLSGL